MAPIPLVPALVLGLFSFLSSAFVLCRVLLPIVPPGPCYRPAPSKRLGLSSADISHIWLSIFDTISLTAFLVQVFYQYQADSLPFDAAKSGDSAARLWLALTTRQTCLFIVLFITLINVRLGRSTHFGFKHVYLWLSTVGIAGTGAIAASLLSIFGFTSLFGGIAVYLSVLTVIAVGILCSLVLTLWRIRRSLGDRKLQEIDSWPVPQKRRTSFTTDEVHAIKNRASWVTSIEGSARRSLSPWSFATSHGHFPKAKHVSRHSMPTSFYSLATGSVVSEINATRREQEHIPPVPPIPSPYKKSALGQNGTKTPADGTPTSWLTSFSDTRKTMSPFSFPTTQTASFKSIAPFITGGCIKDPQQPNMGTTSIFPVSFAIGKSSSLPAKGGLPLCPLAVTPTPRNPIVTTLRVAIWLAMICLPFMLTMPYLVLARSNSGYGFPVSGILLAIAQAVSSPLLALGVLLKMQLPVPSNPFLKNRALVGRRAMSIDTTPLPLHRHSTELRVGGKTSSYTVIEGRRSGDVWIEQGQAVNGRSKAGRVMSLLVPNPRLSVLPFHHKDDPPITMGYGKQARPQSSQIHLSTDEDVDEVSLVPQYIRRTYATDSSPSLATEEGSLISQFQVMTAKRYQPCPVRTLQFTGGQSVYYGPPLTPPPPTPLPSRPDEFPEEGCTLPPRAMDILAAGIAPNPIPGLTGCENQKIIPYRKNLETSSLSTSGSEKTHELYKSEGSDITFEASRGPRRIRSSHSVLAPPDCHSTPRFRFPKHPRDHQSLPPLPGNSNAVYQPAKVPRSTPVAGVTDWEDDQDGHYSISLVPEDDTLSRKLNSLIRSLSSRGAPSRGSESHPVSGQNPHNILLPLKSPVKPLVPRQEGRVMKRKSDPQGFSPDSFRQGNPPKKSLPRKPRNNKVLYNISPSHALRKSLPTTISPEGQTCSVGHTPAVNSLSTITDYGINKKPVASPLEEAPGLRGRWSGNASFGGEFTGVVTPAGGKENDPIEWKSPVASLGLTDTAKHRTWLIQSQQLPIVRVRPPSGGSFQAFAPKSATSTWTDDMI